MRDGKPFTNDVVGHYAYHVNWSPDGKELLFNRTNRRQNILEMVAAEPASGEVRVVLREEWPTGWIENSPTTVFLKDNRRFIWQSERNGWKNFYLYDLSGKLITPLTTHTTFETAALVKVDEAAGVMFYTARDGDNPLKLQLHRVGLDGRGDVRLTDPKFHHTVGSCMPAAAGGRGRGGAGSCGIAADNRHFVDVYQTHNTPPATRVVDAASGKTVAEVVASDLTKFEQLGLKKAEMFTFKAADGQTTLHGLIQFPSTFDPSRKYPVLVQVYGGPASASNTARETFVTPSPLTEYGFLVVNVDSRAAPGRGKRLLDQIYLKLGQVEIDDMAAGVRSLGSRPYVDAARVGMFGTSYGGYASVMSLLRHPDVYAAASASSPVTAWNHYDTIYTERYMWIPQENKAGYDAGSAMTYAKDLKGRLMLYWGTADNNVHPSNMMQLISRAAGGRQELRRAGGSGSRPQRHQYRPHDGVLHRGAEGAVRILMRCMIRGCCDPRTASRLAVRRGQGGARLAVDSRLRTAPERADRRDDAAGGAAARPARAAAGGQPPGGAGAGVAPRLPAAGDHLPADRTAAAAARYAAGDPHPVAAGAAVDGGIAAVAELAAAGHPAGSGAGARRRASAAREQRVRGDRAAHRAPAREQRGGAAAARRGIRV